MLAKLFSYVALDKCYLTALVNPIQPVSRIYFQAAHKVFLDLTIFSKFCDFEQCEQSYTTIEKVNFTCEMKSAAAATSSRLHIEVQSS